ncbi:20124_t:CDS:2, partial [Rhizophagus irregularis]
DDSCRICHPVLTIPDRYFLRFWNWYSLEIPTLSYSAKTVQYFYEYTIKIYTARERFQNFNLDPFVHYQHEDKPLGYELSFITPPTSPILRYPRNLLFVNEPLYLELLFEDENMLNLQNNQGQGQPPNRFNQAPQVNQADIQALTAAVQALTGQMLAPNNLGNAMNTLNATVAVNNNALQNRNHNVVQVPTFNGGNQDPITWLNEFNATATANGWNDARKLQVVPAYLKGPAAVWYQAAVLAPINAWAAAANANNFQHAFLTQFRTAAMVKMWATELDQRQQQPNESVDEYASSIQELYQRVNDAAFAYPDNLQARKFVSGLIPELYIAVKPFGDQTLADAIGRAKGCELTLRSGKMKLLNYAGQTTSEITELTKLVAALTEQVTEIGKKVTGNRPPPRSDGRSSNVPMGPNRTIVCYTCGEPGHVSRRCPNNPTTTTSGTNPVIASAVTTAPLISTTNDTQSLVQEILKQLNTATEPYPRPVDSEEKSEEKEPSKPINIPPVPHEIPRSAEPTVAADVAEPSSRFAERTNVNNISTTTKKKKAPMIKKKKKTNLQPLISLHVPPYSMVDDIKNQQARITFGQLLEVVPKCRSELIQGIRKPTVRKMNLGEQEIGETATALYCDATIKGTEIPLIIDSGAAGSIVSCQLLKDLKIPIDRPSTTMMINVNVTEAESYAAIVGNDWLSKVKANIDYETSTMNFIWDKQTVEVPVEYRLMPQEKRKLQELVDSNAQSKEESDTDDTDEEETDDDSIKEEEEEFEDDEPEERVFFTMQFEKPKRLMHNRYRNSKRKAEVQKRNSLPESSVILDCKFANVVIDAIYPCEDFVLTNEGIYLGQCFHTWGHFQHLDQKFKMMPPKKATWVYDWKGPKAKCWCQNSLYSPEDACYFCQDDLITYQSVCRLSPIILKELSRGRCDDGVVPSEEQREFALTNQHYNQLTMEKYEQITKEVEYYHTEIGSEVETTPITVKMKVGVLPIDLELPLLRFLVQRHGSFAWDSSELGRTNLIQHSIDTGNNKALSSDPTVNRSDVQQDQQVEDFQEQFYQRIRMLIGSLEDNRQLARSNVHTSQEKQKQRYDAQIRPRQYAIGEQLRTIDGKIRKKWVHADQIRPYVSRPSEMIDNI